MAQLSPTMEEGKLIEWKIREGDAVSQGDIVVEIETDKANMEVEAMGGGVLRKILVQEGETVPVGALIGVIAAPDEAIEDILVGAQAPAVAGGPADTMEEAPPSDTLPVPGVSPAAPEAVRTPAVAAPEAPAVSAGGRVKASPVARRIAAERGLDLAAIAGSGPGGRIVKADVEAAIAGVAVATSPPVESQPMAPAPAAAVAPAPPAAAATSPAAPHTAEMAPATPVTAGVDQELDVPQHLEARVEEASLMRRAIARRLVESIGPVPHFFLTTEIDMGRALALRTELNERWPEGKIGVNDLLLKATAEALARHPGVNASWREDSIVFHGTVDLGIAVAVDGGLITPVVRDASRKGLRQISTEARELIGRARGRKLVPEEYEGATFSVSNLGMYEIDQFTAIINPPESGILAVGRTAEKPVVVDGEVVIRQRMRVTMSCDHRVVDGATGATFLETFKAMLENPLEMIL
jgi:pyruvate dehydrogenase E2 component (dihydrolipoamide acetyltransferase)